MEARRRETTHIRALHCILPMLEHHIAKQQADVDHGVVGACVAVLPSLQQVEEWALEAAWDQQFDLMQRDDFREQLIQADDEEDSLRLQLEMAQRQREVASDVLRQIHQQMDANDFKLTPIFQDQLRVAGASYDRACRDENRIKDEARKRMLEIPSGPAAEAAIKDIERKLLVQYGDLGPHYRILCGRLAEMVYRAEVQRGSGRDLPTTEMLGLNDAILKTINQLQKFTESTKSESLSKDRDALAVALLGVIERIVAPQAPNLWAAIVVGVQRALTTMDQPQQERVPSRVLSLLPKGDDTWGVADG